MKLQVALFAITILPSPGISIILIIMLLLMSHSSREDILLVYALYKIIYIRWYTVEIMGFSPYTAALIVFVN